MCREWPGDLKGPWFRFGEACGLGEWWLFMLGSRCGGVGALCCVAAIWCIRSEGSMDWLCCDWLSSMCGSSVFPRYDGSVWFWPRSLAWKKLL